MFSNHSFNAYAMAVIGTAADLFGVEPSDITGRSKIPRFARPRMAAAWALREADPRKHVMGGAFKVYSLHRLCNIFGWRDHTTAWHAMRRVPELCAEDAIFRAKAEQLLAYAVATRPASTRPSTPEPVA